MGVDWLSIRINNSEYLDLKTVFINSSTKEEEISDFKEKMLMEKMLEKVLME